MIIDFIKADNISARKNKDVLVSSLLSTLYSEVVNVGKNDGNRDTTDKEALAVIKKFLDGVNFTLDKLNETDHTERYNVALKEKEVLTEYVEKFQPKQLTEDQLTGIITEIVSSLPDKSPKQMGAVMKKLKEQYDGMYNGNDASKTVKTILNS